MSEDVGIDHLTDDAILHIFSLLSLVDRGRAARVGTRWNQLMKDSTLWKSINLWGGQTATDGDEAAFYSQKSTWSFARNEHQVLKFLQTYVGGALRAIHLHTVSNDILRCLCVKCPELQFISFSIAFSRLSSKVPSDVDLSLLPGNVSEVVLSSVQRRRTHHNTGRKVARGARVGRFLGQPLPKLSRLTLCDIRFDFELFRRISCCENLKRLELTDCYDLTENGFILITSRVPGIEEIRLEYCRWCFGGKGTLNFSEELTGILRYISMKLIRLKTFHLLSHVEISRVRLDAFLDRLSRFGTLRCISLHRVRGLSLASFQNSVTRLKDLEEFGISQSDDVTDDLLRLVATNMLRLRVLQVPLATQITDIGVLAFTNHPSLTTMNLAFCNGVAGQAMYDTFVSLRKLERVVLSSRSDPILVPIAERILRDMPYLNLTEL